MKDILVVEIVMAVYIKDKETSDLVEELASLTGMSKKAAVKLAVEEKIAALGARPSFREKLETFWRAHPLPPPTGLKADKAFFDELSGDL